VNSAMNDKYQDETRQKRKVNSPGVDDNEGGFNMDDNFFGIEIARSWNNNGRRHTHLSTGSRKCPWGLRSSIHTCRFRT
jgi:hypothetical protein